MLIPLHVKSDRSLGYGTASPSQLVAAAAELGLPALALTDRETLAGQVELHAACRAHGLRAITGLELFAGARYVLLARDAEGYAALCRIATARATERRRAPVPDLLAPEDFAHLFVLSDEPRAVHALIARDAPRSALGLLLVRPSDHADRDAAVVRAAEHMGVPLVADRDIVMVSASDRALHALQVAVRHKTSIATAERAGWVESGARSFSADAASAFADQPTALAHAARIADACRLDLLAVTASSDDPAREAEALRWIATRCRAAPPRGAAYAARLERELSVIEALRLARYFAIALEVAEEARARHVPIAARGSAVSSLVLHLLGLSPIDPIEHGLIFERFVHEGRAEPPDIDLDVAHDRRDALIAWLVARYGADHVAPIASYATWQRRSAYRAALGALGALQPAVERTLARLPGDDLELPVLPEHLPPAQRGARELIERMIARPSHLSVHASGLVWSAGALSRFVPFARAPKARVTQYDGRALEALGLLKLDLLGNRALTERAHTLASLGRAADEPLPQDDRAAWQLVQRAGTVACFQIETPIVRALLRRHPAGTLGELADVLARARPGPAAGGPLLYEEDVIQRIAGALGTTLAHADGLRRAIVNGAADEGAFIAQAERAGLATGAARALWREVAPFASYAFSKAHALSFARLAYDSAYLKAHWPAPFAAAVIDHHGGMYPLRTLLSDLQRAGVRFTVPSVQRARRQSTVIDGSVVIGFDHLKHLSSATTDRLIALQPFRDLDDLIARVRPRPPELSALTRSGACAELAPGSPPPDGARGAAYQALIRIQAELELLGMHVSDHPMRVLRSEAVRVGCLASSELARCAGERVRFAGLIAALRKALTKRGETMAFATFEDEHGLVEAVLPPRALATLGDPLESPGPYLITAAVRLEHGAAELTVDHLMPFHRREQVAERAGG